MGSNLSKNLIIKTAVVLAMLGLVLYFVLPCRSFAADGSSSLRERNVWFTYGYVECTGEEHPASSALISFDDSYDTTYPEYFSTSMMFCDTDHVVRVEGEGVTEDNVTLTSQTPAVLDIDSEGNVSLKKTGTARIKATVAADDVYAERNVYLDVKIDKHESWIDTVRIHYEDRPAAWGLDLDTSDGSHKLVVGIRPGAKVTYSSENTNVARVNASGVVTPVAAGTTQILFDFDDGGGRYKACRIGLTIKVSGEEPQELEERQAWFTYGYTDCLGETVSLSKEQIGYYEYPTHFGVDMMMCDTDHVVHVEGDGVTDDNVIFSSMTPAVLEIDDNGNVTLLKTGRAEIRATVAADGKYEECTIYLEVTIDRHDGWIGTEPVHYEGRSSFWGLDLDTSDEPQQLVVPLRPGASVSYYIVNPNVARVDENGVVTPVSAGHTTIRFDVDDGGGKYKAGYFYGDITVTGESQQGEPDITDPEPDHAAEEAARQAAAAAAAVRAAQEAALKQELVKARSLKKPVLKVKALKGRKIKLTWKKVANADGYIVYIKYPGSKKYRKATQRNATVKSVTHRGLTGKKVYYYKVRAYKVISGKYYYGPFSKVRKARAR